MRCILTALLILLLPTLAASADSAERFPKEITVDGRNLVKLGEYRYVYRIFFKLYEVALYCEAGAGADDVLSAATSFRLQFRYLREIEKAIILESADKMLSKNLSVAEKDAIAARVETINRAYTTVREGDRSSLTYIPDVGTTLAINGKKVITIEGRDFAKHYFKIWLGDTPISTELRDRLLK